MTKKVTLQGNILTWYTIKDSSEKSQNKGKSNVVEDRGFKRRRNTLIKLTQEQKKPKWFITLIVPGGCSLQHAISFKDLLEKLFKTIRNEFPNPRLYYKIEYKGKKKEGYDFKNVGCHVHLWGRMGSPIKKSKLREWFFRKWSRLVDSNDPRSVDVAPFKEKHRGYLTKFAKNSDDRAIVAVLHPRYSFGRIGARKLKKSKIVAMEEKDFSELQKELTNFAHEQGKYRKSGVNKRNLGLINGSKDGFNILNNKYHRKIKKIMKEKGI